jgi:hypothetical protein
MKSIMTTCLALLAIASAVGFADEAKTHPTIGGAAIAECCDACIKAAADSPVAETAELADLSDIATLRDRFNADAGHPRAIALLSPVCPGCIKSADLIRTSLLEKYKDADLKLYVVWLPMIPGDARDRWNAEILRDDRAIHYWNESKSTGKWFADNVTECEPLGPVAWDVIYAFGPDETWEGDTLSAVFCPTPVYAHSRELAANAEKLLGNH